MLTIYKASAGSGKTFTLVYEYVKALLGVKDRGSADGVYRLNADSGHRRREPNRHRGILAITFTNAATKEMKTRVVKALAELADRNSPTRPGDYLDRLSTDFRCSPDAVRDAAAKALGELLYDYSDFHISTIDSFFQAVLRAFSREVDRQVDYDIELDVEGSFRDSVADMLESIKISGDADEASGRLRDWIDKYASSNRRKGKAYNFYNTDGALLAGITRSLKNALDETYNRNADALDEYFVDPSRIRTFIAALDERCRQLTGPVTEAAQRLAGLCRDIPAAETIVKPLKRAQAVLAGETLDDLPGYVVKADPGDDCERHLKTFVTGTKLKENGLTPDDIRPAALAARDFCAALTANNDAARYYKTLLGSAEVLEFFGFARRSQLVRLRESNTMLIADTNRIVRQIIDGADAPFIYERLGAIIHTLLIDEFQDTSQLQWDNLRPLVANSGAEGYDNLIIGDVKQSIYRFRNTDSRLLGEIVQADRTLGPVRLRGDRPEESTNRRSAHCIVGVNNAVFSVLPAAVDCAEPRLGGNASRAYADVAQEPWAKLTSLTGYASVSFPVFDRQPNRRRTEAEIQTLLDKVVADIRRQVASGYDYRDIMVLVRTNNEGKTVVGYLKDRGIPVVSAESLLLNFSPAVRTVVSLMRMVAESYDRRQTDISPEEQTSSRAKTTAFITRFNSSRAAGLSASDAVDRALVSDGNDSLREIVDEIRARNPANIVALADAIIEKKLTPQQRRNEYPYLAAFLDLAVKHAESSDASLRKFLSDYDNNIDRWTIKPAADENAVEVMTIHKSKGLERACVHIPMCDWALRGRDKSLWLETAGLDGFDPACVPPIMWFSGLSRSSPVYTYSGSPFAARLDEEFNLDILDSLNMTYVAFTRAGRELTVQASLLSADKGERLPVSRLLHGAVEAVAADAGLRADPDGTTERFTAGAPTQKYTEEADRLRAEARAEAEAANTILLDRYDVVLEDNGHNPRKLICIDDALSPDPAEEEEVQPVYTLADAAREGIHFHAIMSGVRTYGDLADAAGRYCRRRGLDTEAYLEPLRKAFAESADRDLVAAWFAEGQDIHIEESLYDCERGEVYRPDRVITDGTSATVVDYKFPGPSEDPEQSLPGYKRQVANYMRLLGALGYRHVRGYIWYPVKNRVVAVGR